MIDFKKPELSDKKAIDVCLENNTCRTCDYSFANIYTWHVKFKTMFSIVQDTLFLQFEDEERLLYYMMPMGKLPTEKAIQLLIEDAKARKIPFQMKGVTCNMWDVICERFPNTFEMIHDNNNDEYLYLSEKLVSLAGKKLQSKRNHINRFKRENPDWEYVSLSTPNDLSLCYDLLKEWSEEKEEGADKYDFLATKIMLENFNALELAGGGIKVNGKLVAFSIGGRLTEDTFVVHVEKAFADIHGAYTIVNQQFIEHEASQYKFINREEDLGIDALRKAKLSYQPDMILKERIVRIKQ